MCSASMVCISEIRKDSIIAGQPQAEPGGMNIGEGGGQCLPEGALLCSVTTSKSLIACFFAARKVFWRKGNQVSPAWE